MTALLADALAALERGWSVVPTGLNKRPLLDTWKEYQARQTTRDEVHEWTRDAGDNLKGWAVVTGKLSGAIIIDFDGHAGRELAARWNVRPHVRTGSGGYHLYVQHPGWRVKTLNGKSKEELGQLWPGLDIRADGGYAVFAGGNESGTYEQLRPLEPDDLGVLPADVLEFLGLDRDPAAREPKAAPTAPLEFTRAPKPARAGEPRRADTNAMLRGALDRMQRLGRNNGGFWLACQLRDNSYSQAEASDVLRGYLDNCPPTNHKGEREAYTWNDALVNLKSAYSEPARDPWPDRPPPEYGVTRGGKPVDPEPARRANDKAARKADGAPTLKEYADLYLSHLAVEGVYLAHHGPSDTWWEYANGVYKAVARAEMLRRLDVLLQTAGHDNLSRNKLQDILLKVAHAPGINRKAFDLGPRQLNVRNGILDLETKELRPHSPEFFSTVQTTASWNPDAQAPLFARFLNEILPEKTDRMLIGQFFGYCLTGDTNYQVSLAAIGEGNTGKGTLTYVLREMLGGDGERSLVGSMSLDDLKDGGAQIEALVGKRVLLASENEKSVSWMTFKRITGEDAVFINPKYREPYSATLCCKVIISSNVLPYLGDDATNTSLTRRLLPVEFNITPPVKDYGLRQRLTTPEELSGVLAWAVKCLHALWEAGTFLRPTGTLERQIVEQANRVVTFLDEACHKGGSSRAVDLYQAYREWAERTGHRPISSTRFAGDLIAAGKTLNWPIERTRERGGTEYDGVHPRRLL